MVGLVAFEAAFRVRLSPPLLLDVAILTLSPFNRWTEFLVRQCQFGWNVEYSVAPSFNVGLVRHGLHHTFATELANSDVSVYTLLNLLGHESMTSQRYVAAAGTETRQAAAKNGL